MTCTIRVYGVNNCRLIDAVKKVTGSILIGGDMLVGKNGHSYEPALACVKRACEKIGPVYYAKWKSMKSV